MTYSEKLSDPRWQKKRLLILERDNFSCVKCQADDVQLQIHRLPGGQLDLSTDGGHLQRQRAGQLCVADLQTSEHCLPEHTGHLIPPPPALH